MNGLGLSDTYFKPFDNDTLYKTMKMFPVSWSRPALGRVGLPQGINLNVCDPAGGSCAPCSGGTSGTPDPVMLNGIRNLIFIGGGVRVYNPNLVLFPTDNSVTPHWSQFFTDGFLHSMFDPFVLALDLETGKNAFRYVWPDVFKTAKTYFPDKFTGCDSSGKSCSKRIPYAMSDTLVLDLWNRKKKVQPDGKVVDDSEMGEDGYADYLYIGDVNGTFLRNEVQF